MNTDNSLLQRFWSKIDKSETCWNWTASVNTEGYPQLMSTGKRNRKQVNASKLSYFLHYGNYVDGDLRHLCGNRACVNPTHMIPESEYLKSEEKKMLDAHIRHMQNQETYLRTKNNMMRSK